MAVLYSSRATLGCASRLLLLKIGTKVPYLRHLLQHRMSGSGEFCLKKCCGIWELKQRFCLGERLGAPEMFGEDAGTRTRGAEGLELRLAKGWNEQVSHYDGSETGAGIRNVQEWDS